MTKWVLSAITVLAIGFGLSLMFEGEPVQEHKVSTVQKKAIMVSPVQPAASVQEDEKAIAETVATKHSEKKETVKENTVPSQTKEREEEIAEMKEEMQEIEPDERSEDYYDGSERPNKDYLIGGANIQWTPPKKNNKGSSKFGMPPPVN